MLKSIAVVAASLAVSSQAAGQTARSSLEIAIDGARLTAVSWGIGETVVALPGGGLDVAWFESVGPRIAASGFRFVAVNPRQVAGSTGSLENYDPMHDVVAVLDALKLPKAHLLGWAFGNRIARATATRFPNRVATLTLLAAGGKFGPIPLGPEAAAAIERWSRERELAESHRGLLTLFSYAS